MPSKGEKNYVYADVSHFLGKPGVLFKIYSNILVPEVVVEGGGGGNYWLLHAMEIGFRHLSTDEPLIIVFHLSDLVFET